VKVKLRQKIADLSAVTHKQRKDAAFKSLLKIANTRAANSYSPATESKLSLFAQAVAIARRRINPLATFRFGATQKLSHFLFEEVVDKELNLRANPAFKL
jgi:hypothetical protein